MRRERPHLESKHKGYEMRALLQAWTYGKREPVLALQRNNQQSLDTTDLEGSGRMPESKMMSSLQQRRGACGSTYFMKSLHWINLSLS